LKGKAMTALSRALDQVWVFQNLRLFNGFLKKI
jgi:hypothetical protein